MTKTRFSSGRGRDQSRCFQHQDSMTCVPPGSSGCASESRFQRDEARGEDAAERAIAVSPQGGERWTGSARSRAGP